MLWGETGEVCKDQIMKILLDNHKEFGFFSFPKCNRKSLEVFKQGATQYGLHFEAITLAAL